MIEIWTEDNGAGYLLVKSIFEEAYGRNNIIVVSHEGNGNNKPTYRGSRGGILYDLKRNRMNQNIIFIHADLALDNSNVVFELSKILNELNYHSRDHILKGVYCFEYAVLTYKHLAMYGGFDNSGVQNDINAFTGAIADNTFCPYTALKYKSNYFSQCRDTLPLKSGEQVAKALLSLATSKANIRLSSKKIHGAVIKGSSLGCCWTCDCCKYANACIELTCNPDIRHKIPTKALKMRDLALNSVFKRSITSLDTLLTDKLRSLYDGRGSNYEQRYASEVSEYLKSRRHLVEFLNFVATRGRWNNLLAINYIRRH